MGAEPFIYSQELERLFGLIEGDAKTPYQKLLKTDPLSEANCRHWVAFLTAQLLRTPWFISQNLAHLKSSIETRSLRYPTEIENLRRAHETLFTNADIFGLVYDLVAKRQWRMWKPVAGQQFVRPDNPVVVSKQGDDVSIIYPMTPDQCFVAGPERIGASPVVAERQELDGTQVDAVNRRLAESARATAIARPEDDDQHLRSVLEASLGREWLRIRRLKHLLPDYWGEIE